MEITSDQLYITTPTFLTLIFYELLQKGTRLTGLLTKTWGPPPNVS